MLRYEINRKDINQETTQLNIESYVIEEDMDNEDYLNITCYYSNDLTISEETILHVESEYEAEFVNSIQDPTITTTFDAEISYINPNLRFFAFRVYRWYDLSLESVNIITINNIPYLEFKFNDDHYFTSYEDNNKIYIDFVYDGILYQKIFENCIFEDEKTMLWKYNANSPDIDLFMCTVFSTDTYNFIGYEVEGESEFVEYDSVPSTACFTDDVYIKVKGSDGCEDRYEYYEKDCNDGNVYGLDVYRESFYYDNFIIYIETGEIVLPLPLSQMFDTRLEQEENIKEHFIYDEVRKSINSHVEMEKFVYHPVFVKEDNTFKTEDIYKIKFNLHFRKHSGDNWTVGDNSYWNGVDDETLMFNSKTDGNNGVPFFSYEDKSKQSDLLKYVGFTNSDVKFQKSKLKKSFLRLSFYDSTNPANQNLLAYSTIFLDGGNLFAKYMNNVENEPYVISGGSFDDKFTGVRVDREPSKDRNSSMIADKTDDEIEENRLSTQFVVKDSLFSTASSEGFNLYLWADNDNGNIPTDIYMKVEFNHAGYGRTIPFMMPYYDINKDGRYGVKTFEQIMDDWRSGNEYGMKKYSKYSYIHFKYRYDKEKEKRVYYLDPETYGDFAYYNQESNADTSPNELEINLYEAKVSFLNDND